MFDSADAVQSEGEGPDGSDKPPLDGSALHTHPHSNTFVNGTTYHSVSRMQLPKVLKGAIGGTPHSAMPFATDSPSPSESESWSAPSTRPPSQAVSRAPSISGGLSGNKLVVPPMPKTPQKGKLAPSEKPPPTTSRSRAPSNAHSDSGQKFTLKDLITSAPKLSRKSSARSTSSRKSDSDVERKSVAGESAVSLTQKYGVCQKVAIGKGATSVVRLAHKWDRSEEKLYAVKEFRKRRKNESEKEYVKKLTAEFCISSTLHHVNIVETVDLVQDENQHWCEVMEFCPGGDLYAAIKKGGMSPSEVECCFKQMLLGVSYLHSQGVAHRDIKPENLFFDTKGHLKIGDYGASTVYRLPWEATIHMSTGLCGSEPYIAPEQFLGKPYDARLVDIWACGIVYYCLHFQEMPWRAAQTSDTLYAAYAAACAAQHKDKDKDKDKDVAFPPTITNLSPRACRSLIRKMLEPDPKLRSPIEDVVAHLWVQNIEVCHAVAKPAHVHVHAMQQAHAQLVSS
ncbi:Pkinase-domain-containing protein [Suillus paluster]|uniref:Pkinase-domain-containing protein n=1 Tax=Suillus paluster TaxID=48578 RepID=UPI001B861D30|nr:Pkinase-domain-containing protein [Suillus paluster]KAG1741760.1 Pkinase-domain-containing protein [Suillus paluster]